MAAAHLRWAVVALLSLGAVLTSGVRPQLSPSLRQPLQQVVPLAIDGFSGQDRELAEWEAGIAGVSDYLLRDYTFPGEAAGWFSVYVGYYATQTQGKTIHSPKNCLPGSGWEALAATSATVALTGGGSATVNRYLLQREGERALVLYWYQGRGRVAHSEYAVKWYLLRDAALHRRSEEALVRIVVPVGASEEAAFALARSVAASLIPALERSLPERLAT